MAGELQVGYVTAKTVYAQIRTTTGTIWNTSGTPAFQAYSTAQIANYKLSMTEQGTASGYYTGTFPTGISTAGKYYVTYFEQVGGSAAEADIKLGSEVIEWSGTAAVALYNAPVNVNQIGGSTTAATRHKDILANLKVGTVDTTYLSPTSTVFEASGLSFLFNNVFDSLGIVWTSGNNVGLSCVIDDSQISGNDSNLQVITLAGNGLQVSPSSGETFIVMPIALISDLTPSGKTNAAAAVWNAVRSSYATTGTFGQAMQTVRSGTAQAGASTSITLDASASSVTDFYKNCLVRIVSGTGSGQARFITAYDGSTKVATVATWATNPNNTSVFVIDWFDAISSSAPTTAQIATAIWTDLLASSDFSTASSIGKLIKDYLDAAVTSRMASYTNPTNFSSLSITAAGKVTVGTNDDKTGYSLSQAFPSGFDTLVINGDGTLDSNMKRANGAIVTSRDFVADVFTLIGRLTSTRAGYLDNLTNLDAPITGLNNLSALINIYGSPLLEIPDSSSTDFAFTVVVRDNEGKLVNLDSSPTIAAANAAGTDRSANLSVVSHPATGRYTFTYNVDSSDVEESLRITCSGAVSAESRYIEWIGSVVNYDTLTTLLAVKARTDLIPDNPAAVGDAMTLTSGERTTLAGVVWSSLTSGMSTVGSIGKRIVDYLTGDIFTRLGAPAGVSIAADLAEVNERTANLPNDPASQAAVDAAFDDLPTAAENATAVAAQVTSDHGSGSYVRNTEPPTASDNATAVAAAITADHGAGSYTRNTEPLTATETRTALGLANNNLDSQLGALPTASEIRTEIDTNSSQLDALRKLAEADWFVDKNTTPWQLVAIEAGTGAIGVGTEILRKILKDVDGANVTASTTVIGQAYEV